MRGGILVECRGPLAEQLATFREATVGRRVTVWGTIEDREFTPKGKAKVTFQALAATRVRVPEVGDLPIDASPEPVAAPGGSTELTEAESEAIWAEVERIGA